MNVLAARLKKIELLFDMHDGVQASNETRDMFAKFEKKYPECVEDMHFCLEILKGKHPLGLTLTCIEASDIPNHFTSTLEQYRVLYLYKTTNSSENMAHHSRFATPFLCKLFNREYRLGYSGLDNMITNLSPMLAHRYPDAYKKGRHYEVQQKFNGHRCIAFCVDGSWNFQSRSGKPQNVNFDMSWADEHRVYDGEIMGRDLFNKDFSFQIISGMINSNREYDKRHLVYHIYDIVDRTLPYYIRKNILQEHQFEYPSKNVHLVRTLGLLDNNADEFMADIIEQGGEGIMLRDVDAHYEHKRSYGLLKYKPMYQKDKDLMLMRIVDWKEGKGKYAGAIGSFECVSESGVKASVGALPESVRFDDPDKFIGRWLDVKYATITDGGKSLQFPQFECWRNDV